MNIFVARLNFDSTEDGLRELFEGFGAVDSAKIIMDRETGKSKGYGFVEMPDNDEANSAIEALNETDFDDRTIVVKEASPRKGGGRDGGFRGGNNRGRFNRNNNNYRDRGNSRRYQKPLYIDIQKELAKILQINMLGNTTDAFLESLRN